MKQVTHMSESLIYLTVLFKNTDSYTNKITLLLRIFLELSLAKRKQSNCNVVFKMKVTQH